ncbi:Oxoglutarate and iron-dependent oxygenase degradation C-term-domain-containing protein [Xylogone sp. PMI_703]|nr:Oxoglutarate and iron-dependent oxygenase degradation C-term-domain-containing protein [Xylogone sp. PMI_703]
MTVKRKAEDSPNAKNLKSALRKRPKTDLSEEEVQKSFRKGLFAPDVLQKYTDEYTQSEPYKHCVIGSLINDDLLRSVRNEIREHVSFTPKETDIYRIHQSGDLANLDGLDDGALEKLPSLLRLRDSLYSSEFRKYAAAITGSGELSGRKTDMAINVYTPGCHLLCHDDVIGSRRISYILYLTDPDIPWKEEWGGALRLFPTKTLEDEGMKTVTPSPDVAKIIPPAWNQLSFFAVQPGESFHDVEEVYHAETKEQLEKDGGRIRMAISGWFHIPQIGEEGYIEGEEERWGVNSSLKQLQGNPDKYDFPKPLIHTIEESSESSQERELNEADLDFLLKYMAPDYLTPDTLEEVSDRFMEESSVTLGNLLSKKFAARAREYVETQEKLSLPESSDEVENQTSWKVAKPPHKHRFLYQQPMDGETITKSNGKAPEEHNPIKELIEEFLPSRQFRLWLEVATGCEIENYNIMARRFRRGLDYSLATNHVGKPRLEISLGLTPTPGWGLDDEDDEEEEVEAEGSNSETNGKAPAKSSNGKKAANDVNNKDDDDEDENGVGGHEVYMAGDDEDDEDAAIYKASTDPDDDNTLFTMPASWNTMSIVLRDSGVLKFVKYVSRKAKGDRWDVTGSFGVKDLGDDDGDQDGEGEENGDAEGLDAAQLGSSEEEEEFNGFSDSEDSDSD